MPQALSYCRVYKENRPLAPAKFVIKSLRAGANNEVGKHFFGGSRTEWLQFFGPTNSGECAVFPGKTNSGLYFKAISNVKDGSRCGWECARQHNCGHWVHDMREKKCYLYPTRWEVANADYYPTEDRVSNCAIHDSEILKVSEVQSDCLDLTQCEAKDI